MLVPRFLLLAKLCWDLGLPVRTSAWEAREAACWLWLRGMICDSGPPRGLCGRFSGLLGLRSTRPAHPVCPGPGPALAYLADLALVCVADLPCVPS